MPVWKGYAIISSEGMIAHADGSFPLELKRPGDQRFFRGSVTAADAIIHGRNSGEGWAETKDRPRIILTRRVASLSADPNNARAVLWNPSGASLTNAWALLAIDKPDAVAAVLGGSEVFDLFLDIGYHEFLLSCADVSIGDGRKVFTGPQTPQAKLKAYGLVLHERHELDAEPRVMLERWCRSE